MMKGEAWKTVLQLTTVTNLICLHKQNISTRHKYLISIELRESDAETERAALYFQHYASWMAVARQVGE